MDEMTYGGAGYDYRRHDRLWQRVAPSMPPYPEGGRMTATGGRMTATGGGMTGAAGMALSGGGAPAGGAVPSGGMAPSGGGLPGLGTASGTGTAGAGAAAAAPDAALETLPGAVSDPCCMGSAAKDDLAVLEGFREQELADGRYYQAMLCAAPQAGRGVLRELIARKQAHGRTLGAFLYLITGRRYGEEGDCQRIYVGNWCPALRQRYHEEACAGFNYLRAAEGTADPCLQKAYRRLSEESYQQADWVTGLLEKALGGSCTRPGMGV